MVPGNQTGVIESGQNQTELENVCRIAGSNPVNVSRSFPRNKIGIFLLPESMSRLITGAPAG
jgi:hypothetical protein